MLVNNSTKIIDIMREWIGLNEADGTHMIIIDRYNKMDVLPRKVIMTQSMNWCAATVTAAFDQAGLLYLINGGECGCDRMIQHLSAKYPTQWFEDGRITPKVGDIVYYNWDDNTQDNDGWADHIGIVDEVFDNTFTAIEGNYHNSVKKRTVKIGYGCIRGFFRPAYINVHVPTQPVTYTDIALEIIAGLHGNGHAQREASIIRKYGEPSNYDSIRAEVNKIISERNTSKYYEKYTGDSKRIDDVFRDIKAPYGNWTVRKEVAIANDINNYVGSAAQNTKLIKMAKEGILVRCDG